MLFRSLAASGGHEGIVKLLLERKEVNPDSSDYYGRTPLWFAASGGHEGTVKLLLERKEVNPDSPDKDVRTPLSHAASGGHEGIVKLLLERKDVNPDSSDKDGETPLSLAVERGYKGIVKLLVDRMKVNHDSSDRNDRTPLSVPASGGHEGVVNLLLQRGDVNPNSSDSDSQTPLSHAILIKREGVEGQLSDARSSYSESFEIPDRIPASLTAEAASHHEVTHPLIPTDDATLRTTNDPPLDALISGSVPPEAPQEQPPQFKPSPPGQLHLRVATPIPTPATRSISPSSAAPLLSPRSTYGTTSDPTPSKPSGALKRCFRAIRELFCLS